MLQFLCIFFSPFCSGDTNVTSERCLSSALQVGWGAPSRATTLHWNKSALDASWVRWGMLWTCLTRTPQISLEVLSDPPVELEGLARMRSELLCDLETWMNTELFPWWESDCRQPASQSQYFNSKAAQVHISVLRAAAQWVHTLPESFLKIIKGK